ncbi:MAG: Ig-like domain-containing protein, partial [Gemmatimonadales bacterium]|nr:Ig-like domain-containing protein [Gemmatimonadales bacterium]
MRFSRYASYAFAAALAGAVAVACGGGDSLVLPEDAVPAAIAIIKGDGQAGTVGAPLSDSLIVRVTDVNNRPVRDQTVEFTVTAGGGTITPVTGVTNADGRAGARWVLGSGAGTQRAQARVTGNGAPPNLVAAFSAIAGSGGATTLAAVSGNAQSATSGSALTDSLVVRVTDPAGNAVAGVTVLWSVSDNGSVSAPSVVTGADGRAAVKRTLGTTAGPQTTTATSGTLAGSPVTFTATATVGSAGQLTISRQPSGSAQSGVAFSQQPQVQLRDANGNPVAQAGVAIEVELGSGPTGGSIIGSTLAATNAAGLATFSGLGLSGPSGSYTLIFTGATQPFTGVTSSPVLIGSGSGARLRISVPPSATASSGVPLGTQPRIQLEDAAGNPVAQAGIAVTVQALAVSGGPVSLGGTTTANTDANGVAAFGDLSLSGPAGSQVTLNFASPGLTGTGSGTITLGSGNVSPANSTLQVTGSPITASGGSSTATVTVTARDAANNVVPGAAVAVAVTGTNAVSSAPVTDASGNSTVTVSSTQAGIKTVTATINGVSIAQ